MPRPPASLRRGASRWRWVLSVALVAAGAGCAATTSTVPSSEAAGTATGAETSPTAGAPDTTAPDATAPDADAATPDPPGSDARSDTDADAPAATVAEPAPRWSPAEAAVAATAQGLVNPPAGYAELTAGTGDVYVVGPDGLAVTPHHVVAGASTVSTSAGPAQVLGWSECHDLAVLRIEADQLPATSFDALVADPPAALAAAVAVAGRTPEALGALVDQLSAGAATESLGLNLLPVEGRGLWVAGVDPSGPAGTAGVQPGDLVVRFEGLDLWDDPDLGAYCRTIRDLGPEAPFDFNVNRSATGREWGTLLNSGTELVRTGSQYPPVGYTSIQDPSGSFFFYAPESWEFFSGTGPLNPTDPTVYASSDVESLTSSFDVAGLALSYGADLGADDITGVLDAILNGLGPNCRFGSDQDYDDGLYVGRISRYVDCGPAGAEVAFFVAAPTSDDHVMYGYFQILDDADRAVMDIVLNSLKPL